MHNLFQNIYKHPLIGAQELQQIQKAHQPIAFRKGDFILRKDEIARGYLILQTGVARAFVYDYEGKDISTDFFCEGEIIVQELSLFKHLPSAENILSRLMLASLIRLRTYRPKLSQWEFVIS